MQGIREYLIGVIAVAFLCGIVSALTDSKSSVGHALRLLSGLLMLLAVVHPWANLSFDGLQKWPDSLVADGTEHTLSGQLMADEAYRASIMQQTRAYILEEAGMLGCTLSVEVELSDDNIPVPKRIRISGDVSPYAKQSLTTLLTQKLGIDREDLLWT